MVAIAMTREMGTLGKDVAQGIADSLGLKVIHSELIEHDLADAARGTLHANRLHFHTSKREAPSVAARRLINVSECLAPLLDDQQDLRALRIDDGKPVLGREEPVALHLRDFLHDRVGECADLHVAGDVSAFRDGAQAKGAAAAHVDFAEEDGLARLRSGPALRRTAACCRLSRHRDDLDDLVGVRFDNADLVVDHHVPVAAILRHDADNGCRQGHEANRFWQAGANVDRDGDVGGTIQIAVLRKGLPDIRALLLGKLHAVGRTVVLGLGPCALGRLVLRCRGLFGGSLAGCPGSAFSAVPLVALSFGSAAFSVVPLPSFGAV